MKMGFDSFDDLIKAVGRFTKERYRSPAVKARLKAKQAKRTKANGRARRKVERWLAAACAPKPIKPATQLQGLAKAQAIRWTTEPRRADLILRAMKPNVAYSRKQLGQLIGVKALGSTLKRDLWEPGYIRRHEERKPVHGFARGFPWIVYNLTRKGIERAKEVPAPVSGRGRKKRVKIALKAKPMVARARV